MKRIIARACALIAVLLAAPLAVAEAENLKDIDITDAIPWESCATSFGLADSCLGADCNPYLPLIEGRVWVLDNFDCEDCDEFEKVQVSMLNEFESFNGQVYRVMEEREWVGDDPEELELAEVARNFVAMCPNTKDVFYFGEDECIPADDEDAEDEPPFPDHYDCESIGMAYLPPGEGAWRAGLPGAEPGLLMQGGTFLLNGTYFQEQAEDYGALDWAQNAESGLSEAGFYDCVLVLDRNLLEDPKSKAEGDEKVYCPGIGIVRDEDLELDSCTDTGGADCTQ